MNPCLNIKYTLALLLVAFGLKAQTEIILSSGPATHAITPADTKFTDRLVPLQYKSSKAAVLKIPKRKNDSPFFCDELIKYKNGYIVNSITTSPSAGITDVTYDFYYLDMLSSKLLKLKIPGLDTIESIITYDNFTSTYASGKERGIPKIVALNGGNASNINATITGEMQLLGADSWIKLCKTEQGLYAIDKNGLYIYNNSSWLPVAKFSVDSFYTQNLHYRRSKTVIPTENIRIYNNVLYFLQEVVQQRDCYLVEYDLNNKRGLVNFWDTHGIHDNYAKEINGYTILADGSVLIGASRLMENNLLLKEKGDSLSVFVFNNMVSDGYTMQGDIQARKAILVDSAIYIAANNGVFKIEGTIVTPVAFFTNGTQEIKSKDGNIHFDFNPRCFEASANGVYLIGGLFGGLYKVDVNANKIICLDDIDTDKITSITLGDIE